MTEVMDPDQSALIEAVEADVGSRLERAAEQTVAAAKAAYAAEGHVRSGELVAGVYAVVNKTEGYYKVVVPKFVAAFIEFGTKHQPARHTLARAMAANADKTIVILQGE